MTIHRACICRRGITVTIRALPTVSIIEGEGTAHKTQNIPSVISAEELFIKCDNAVFSGSQIRAKALEMIVSGDLTIESLRDTFKAESENSEFSGSLAAMFNAVHKVPTKAFLDHRLSAVPNFRMAEEDELIEL